MIGFPNESMEDIEAICALCKEVLAIGKSEMGHRASLNISINTFIPETAYAFSMDGTRKPGIDCRKTKIPKK